MTHPFRITEINIPAADAAELAKPYSLSERIGAIKLGMLEALAINGIEPEVFEFALRRAAFEEFDKQAFNPGDLVDAPAKILGMGKSYGLAALLAGTIAGGYSGMARHDIEQSMKGEGDPESQQLERRIKTYAQMRQDLMSNLASRGKVPASAAI